MPKFDPEVNRLKAIATQLSLEGLQALERGTAVYLPGFGMIVPEDLAKVDKAFPGWKKRFQTQGAQSKENTLPNTAQVIQLPMWPEVVRAVPNGILRSALFGIVRRGRRRYMERETIAAVDGIEIVYTGQKLDQGDLDAWEAILHAVRAQPLGNKCRVTSYQLLKLMGLKNTGGRGGNRQILRARITRLVACAVEIRDRDRSYIGSLVRSAAVDKATGEWIIEIDPALAVLYGPSDYTLIDWAVRHKLAGHQLAQWLHAFYSTHAEPYPLKIATLRRLCGSEISETWKFAQVLRRALDAVVEACAANGQAFSYEIKDDLVSVRKDGSASQHRHLIKQEMQD